MTKMMFDTDTMCISNTIQHSDKRSFYVNSKSLEIKLKKEVLKIDLILQFISALLYSEILKIQVNRETRKILQLRKGRFTIQNVLDLVGTIRSL